MTTLDEVQDFIFEGVSFLELGEVGEERGYWYATMLYCYLYPPDDESLSDETRDQFDKLIRDIGHAVFPPAVGDALVRMVLARAALDDAEEAADAA